MDSSSYTWQQKKTRLSIFSFRTAILCYTSRTIYIYIESEAFSCFLRLSYYSICRRDLSCVIVARCPIFPSRRLIWIFTLEFLVLEPLANSYLFCVSCSIVSRQYSAENVSSDRTASWEALRFYIHSHASYFFIKIWLMRLMSCF